MNKSTYAPANVSPLNVLGELNRKWVPITGWGDRMSIYIALIVFSGCAFSCRGSDEYLGKWHTLKNEEAISFNYEFRQDNKIYIIGTNKAEVIELVGNYTMTLYSNHAYLLDYKLISRTTNGVKTENIDSFPYIYYYCIAKIENGEMIIKTGGSRMPDDKVRPIWDGAGVRVVLVRD